MMSEEEDAITSMNDGTVAEDSPGEPIVQVIPPPSSGRGDKTNRVDRRSVATRAFDRGNKGYLDENEKLMRKYDEDGDGKMDISEVFKIVEDVRKETARGVKYKRYFFWSMFLTVVVLAGNFALTWAVVITTRQTETKNGAIVDPSTGAILATRSRGSHVTATVDNEYVNRKRRRILGWETEDDRRFLQNGEYPRVATVLREQVKAALGPFQEDGTPISVTVKVGGVTYTRLVSGSGFENAEMPDGKLLLTGLAAVDIPVPSYNVECASDSLTCDVYQVEDFAVTRRLDYALDCADVAPEDYEDCTCFSPAATVFVPGKGVVAMQDLQVGDKVLAANNQLQTVYTFTHMHRTKPAVFLQIHTDSSEMPLELTETHMLFLEGKANPVPAHLVKLGDALAGANGPRVVTKIGGVVRNGFYAPHTTDGTIMVDGILASAYTSFQGTEYLEVFGIKTLSHQTFEDILNTPFRKFCMLVSIDLCNKYTDEDGRSFWDHLGKEIVRFCKKQNIIVQVAVYGSLTLLVLVAYVALSSSALSTLLAGYVVLKFMKRKHHLSNDEL